MTAMLHRTGLLLVAGAMLTACSDSTAPSKAQINPYADLGLMHNTLLEVGMQAARLVPNSSIADQQDIARDAAIRFRRSDNGITAGLDRVRTPDYRIALDRLTPTNAPGQTAFAQKLNAIMADTTLGIAALNTALDGYDAEGAKLPTADAQAGLIASSIARASANYWYANTRPVGSYLMWNFHIESLLQTTTCGTFSNPCSTNGPAIWDADYAGAIAGISGSLGPCIGATIGYLACVAASGLGVSAGSSIGLGITQMYGSGGSSSTPSCPSGKYAIYNPASASIVCAKMQEQPK